MRTRTRAGAAGPRALLDAQRRQRRRQPLAQLLGGPRVERDGRDRSPDRRPVATSHATRATSVVVLPLPAGAMHRTGPGRRGGGRPLVRGEARQPLGDGGRQGRGGARPVAIAGVCAGPLHRRLTGAR